MSAAENGPVQLSVPPDGFVHEWTPEDEHGPHGWRAVGIDEGNTYRCRANAGPKHPACGRPSTMALNRGLSRDGVRHDSWWHYCSEHAYGRKLRGGVVVGVHLVPIEVES